EDVKGLSKNDKGNTLDTMIKTLNDIGYVVDFDVLNSKYFRVPHNSERICIVAIREDLIEADPFSEESTAGNTIVPKGKRRIGAWAKTLNFDFPEQMEVTTRLRDILESEVDEKYYLDEEKTAKLVAQLDNIVKTQLIDPSHAKREGKMRAYDEVSPTLNARDYKEPRMLGHVDLKGHDAIKRVYSAEAVGPTLTTMGGGHREPKMAEEQSNKPRYRIRKLTPLECWRLQGFPGEAHEAVKQAGISDSQRYKQAGNAVTVSVIEAIAERLIPIVAD